MASPKDRKPRQKRNKNRISPTQSQLHKDVADGTRIAGATVRDIIGGVVDAVEPEARGLRGRLRSFAGEQVDKVKGAVANNPTVQRIQSETAGERAALSAARAELGQSAESAAVKGARGALSGVTTSLGVAAHPGAAVDRAKERVSETLQSAKEKVLGKAATSTGALSNPAADANFAAVQQARRDARVRAAHLESIAAGAGATAGAAADAAKSTADTVVEKVKGAAGAAGEKVSEAVDAVKERLDGATTSLGADGTGVDSPQTPDADTKPKGPLENAKRKVKQLFSKGDARAAAEAPPKKRGLIGRMATKPFRVAGSASLAGGRVLGRALGPAGIPLVADQFAKNLDNYADGTDTLERAANAGRAAQDTAVQTYEGLRDAGLNVLGDVKRGDVGSLANRAGETLKELTEVPGQIYEIGQRAGFKARRALNDLLPAGTGSSARTGGAGSGFRSRMLGTGAPTIFSPEFAKSRGIPTNGEYSYSELANLDSAPLRLDLLNGGRGGAAPAAPGVAPAAPQPRGPVTPQNTSSAFRNLSSQAAQTRALRNRTLGSGRNGLNAQQLRDLDSASRLTASQLSSSDKDVRKGAFGDPSSKVAPGTGFIIGPDGQRTLIASSPEARNTQSSDAVLEAGGATPRGLRRVNVARGLGRDADPLASLFVNQNRLAQANQQIGDEDRAASTASQNRFDLIKAELGRLPTAADQNAERRAQSEERRKVVAGLASDNPAVAQATRSDMYARAQEGDAEMKNLADQNALSELFQVAGGERGPLDWLGPPVRRTQGLDDLVMTEKGIYQITPDGKESAHLANVSMEWLDQLNPDTLEYLRNALPNVPWSSLPDA